MPICEIWVKAVNVAAPKQILIADKSEFTPRAFYPNIHSIVAIAEVG